MSSSPTNMIPRANGLCAVSSMLRDTKCIARWTVASALIAGTAPGLGAAREAEAQAAIAPADSSSISPADSLSVEQCISLARERAPEVVAAAAMHGAARADSIAIGFNRRPALSLDGGATAAPRGFYDPAFTNLGEYRVQLAAEWPLLDAGARARERARAALEAAAAAGDRAVASREAGMRAAAVALDALRQRENERTRAESLGWLERLAAVLEPAVRAGARTRADAMRVGLERSTVGAALLDARQARASLERELVELVGRAETSRVAPTEPGPEAEVAPAVPDSLRLLARADESLAIRQSQVAEARARLAIEEARRRNALQFGVRADAGLAGTDLTSPVPQDLRASNPDATFADRLRRDLGASIAVQVRRPLADPSFAPAVRARTEALRAATIRRELTRARARREARDLLDRWHAAAGRRDLADLAALRADENLLRLRSLYAGGASGLLELLDARRQLDDARERLADARFEARLAHFEAEIP